VEHLWRREEGGSRPGDDLGRLNVLADMLKSRNEQFQPFCCSRLLLPGPTEYGLSNLVSFRREDAYDKQIGRCVSSQITSQQSEYWNGRQHKLLLSERMPKLQDWRFFLSFFPTMAFLLSISFLFFIFKDCVLTVCDDTHALSSQR
jgi:hypothetical protein